MLAEQADKEPAAAVVARARRAGAQVRRVPRRELDRLCRSGGHQGFALRVAEDLATTLDALLSLSAEEKAGALVVALDQIQDPHNFGAIARSAACFGARALLIPERRNAPASQAALSASAGALGRIPVIQVVNLAQGLVRLKEAGFWIYGADRSGTPAWKVRLNRPTVLVVGSEGDGLRPLVSAHCDELASVPQAEGGVESLNASCAASVLLYEWRRQSESSGGRG